MISKCLANEDYFYVTSNCSLRVNPAVFRGSKSTRTEFQLIQAMELLVLQQLQKFKQRLLISFDFITDFVSNCSHVLSVETLNVSTLNSSSLLGYALINSGPVFAPYFQFLRPYFDNSGPKKASPFQLNLISSRLFRLFIFVAYGSVDGRR